MTEQQPQEQEGKNEKQAPTAPPTDTISQTSHSVTIGGKTLYYTATTGRIILKAEDEKEGEKPKAAIFFVAYTVNPPDEGDREAFENSRPITFAFNGGPGSSSVWLHLGVLGPRRVVLEEDGRLLPPPYRLIENEFSLLDRTDLVFIDPVTTGFSRAVPGEKDKQFHGFKADIESVGDFIRLFISRYHRWGSPRFLKRRTKFLNTAGDLKGLKSEEAAPRLFQVP